LAPELPKDVPQSNWLPTTGRQGFSLNFRMYVAKPEVVQGNWFPPPIKQVK
jgi:hypothetical protein